MLGKLKAMIGKLGRRVDGEFFAKGLAVNLEGQGASDPLTTNEYNIASVVRVGVGRYDVTMSQASLYGVGVVLNGTPLVGNDISSNPVSILHIVPINISGGVIEVTVQSLEKSGADIVIVPYDIVAGDFVFLSILVNYNSGTLPPE